ncbi:MAG: hypothetical protein QOD42_737 [Sphingomonadales bacterium]|jgi:hypothetical protein|nr:hypothetical protein [Sphingomonadales bacterium]
MNAAALIRPLLSGTPAGWHGLPPVATGAFDAALGPPEAVADEDLGHYPAERRTYRVEGRAVAVWARAGAVVMVEIAAPLPPSVLDGIEPPCAVLPNELLVEGGYAHEYLFCARGLVATFVESRAAGGDAIIRLRGIAPLATADEFGPALYKPFEDQIGWADAAGDAIGWRR